MDIKRPDCCEVLLGRLHSVIDLSGYNEGVNIYVVGDLLVELCNSEEPEAFNRMCQQLITLHELKHL
jgi:hypothetical protein